MKRGFWTVILVFFAAAVCGGEPVTGKLPSYLQENHNGSFRWIATHIDLDEPHLLILIDAHSDATTVDHSDEIREGIRRVVTLEERAQRIDRWTSNGRIQAYNWIEPLLPSPIERVLWIAKPQLTRAQQMRLQEQARDAIDGRIEFEARQSGSFAERWSVTDTLSFEKAPIATGPVLASIDLDFFTRMPEPEAEFIRLWNRLLEHPNLRGVTFAISRPWLQDDAEAFRLLQLALNQIRLVRGAEVEFEPFIPPGKDDSLKAREFAARGVPVPALHIEQAPPELRAFLGIYGGDYGVRVESEKWRELLEQWQPVCTIDLPLSVDGIYRTSPEDLPVLRVQSSEPPTQMRWWALKPAFSCYNLFPDLHVGKGFTNGAAPWVREIRINLGETSDGALTPGKLRAQLDSATGWGQVRIEAEVKTETGWLLTPPVEVRVAEGRGFQEGLSEQFGMPYVFGIGTVADQKADGPDLGWGNDCANYLVYAWRRTGRFLPWCNPAQLRSYLEPVAEEVTLDSAIALPEGAPERGLVVDFGNHVSALWKDVEPLGRLDRNDEMVHHLGGFPEKTTLGTLAETRPRFAVRQLPSEKVTRILVFGDVVLADVSPDAALHLKKYLPPADLMVANLEGIPGTYTPSKKRYNFTFPSEYLGVLQSLGIQAVSLANNHAADAGVQAIPAARQQIEALGIGVFGAGADLKSALQPWRVEVNGVKLSFIGISFFDSDAAEEGSPGIVVMEKHRSQIAEQIGEEKMAGRTVIVVPHWGREYTSKLDEEQIASARWLVDHGADAVAGSHPHVVQALQFWRGKPVAFSLGNAVYPEKLRGADSGAALLLELGTNGRVQKATLTRIGDSR